VTYNHKVETGSLYLHWPFCPYRCHFCPFIALAGHDEYVQRYHDSLCKEVERFAQLCVPEHEIDTIFIGGGTPSTWPDKLLLDMFDKLKGIFVIKRSAEISIEVNPGTVREEQLSLWADIGINRLSIGVQSLNDAVLKKVNRLQKAEDVLHLLKKAKEKFENISVDLILGLPEVSDNEWKQVIEKVVHWPIKHISIYFLSVHKKTKLFYGVQSGTVHLPSEERLVDLYNWSVDFLAKNGFERYEVSNFAKPGYECRHNEVYWERLPYKGFGLGACSFDGNVRFKNHANLMDYLEGTQKCENVEGFSEKLTKDQVRLEKLMLGLRRPKGVSYVQIFENLSQEKKEALKRKLALLEERKIICKKDGRIFLDSSSFVIENEVVLELLV